VRFFLDNDVDVAVGRLLREHGHVCWAAAEAGLAAATDEAIAVYAEDRDAALISHDSRFAKRRRRNTSGQHVWLHCEQVDAVEVLGRHLAEVVQQLERMSRVVLEVSADRVRTHPPAWE
jgi:predicted nuclease of predicted toxin-antitoxin system